MPRSKVKPIKGETREQLAQRLQIQPGEFDLTRLRNSHNHRRTKVFDTATGHETGKYEPCSCGKTTTNGVVYR